MHRAFDPGYALGMSRFLVFFSSLIQSGGISTSQPFALPPNPSVFVIAHCTLSTRIHWPNSAIPWSRHQRGMKNGQFLG